MIKKLTVIFTALLFLLTVGCGSAQNMTEAPRYRFVELKKLDMPNETVQKAFDTWSLFRDSGQFSPGELSKKPHSLLMMFRTYCDSTGQPVPYTEGGETWIDAAAVEQFAAEFFGIPAQELRENAAEQKGYYYEGKGYCDPDDLGVTLTPLADAALLGYEEKDADIFIMTVCLCLQDPETGEPMEYANTPMAVTVDLSTGRPVFLSALPTEL